MHLAGVPRGLPDSDDLTSCHSLPGGGGDPSGLLALARAEMGAFVERAACRGHVGGAASGAGTSPERRLGLLVPTYTVAPSFGGMWGPGALSHGVAGTSYSLDAVHGAGASFLDRNCAVVSAFPTREPPLNMMPASTPFRFTFTPRSLLGPRPSPAAPRFPGFVCSGWSRHWRPSAHSCGMRGNPPLITLADFFDLVAGFYFFPRRLC